jgi:hypothetical protein
VKNEDVGDNEEKEEEKVGESVKTEEMFEEIQLFGTLVKVVKNHARSTDYSF